MGCQIQQVKIQDAHLHLISDEHQRILYFLIFFNKNDICLGEIQVTQEMTKQQQNKTPKTDT